MQIKPSPCLSILLTTLILLAASCQSAGPTGESQGDAPVPVSVSDPGASTAEAPEPSTLDGIYTTDQAERGRRVFQNTCSECHATEDWQDEYFLARWDGESVYRFWHYIYEQMPNGEPPYSLPREHVTDVLTYILQLNGLPAGDAELGSDEDSIDDHWLYWGLEGTNPGPG